MSPCQPEGSKIGQFVGSQFMCSRQEQGGSLWAASFPAPWGSACARGSWARPVASGGFNRYWHRLRLRQHHLSSELFASPPSTHRNTSLPSQKGRAVPQGLAGLARGQAVALLQPSPVLCLVLPPPGKGIFGAATRFAESLQGAGVLIAAKTDNGSFLMSSPVRWCPAHVSVGLAASPAGWLRATSTQ